MIVDCDEQKNDLETKIEHQLLVFETLGPGNAVPSFGEVELAGIVHLVDVQEAEPFLAVGEHHPLHLFGPVVDDAQHPLHIHVLCSPSLNQIDPLK